MVLSSLQVQVSEGSTKQSSQKKIPKDQCPGRPCQSIRRKVIVHCHFWQPTPVFLPTEFHGQRNRVGCCPWGRTESDMTEATACISSQFIYLCVFLKYVCKTFAYGTFPCPFFCCLDLLYHIAKIKIEQQGNFSEKHIPKNMFPALLVKCTFCCHFGK